MATTLHISGGARARTVVVVALAAFAVTCGAQAAPAERLTLPDPLPARAVELPILMYHRINVTTPATPAASRGLTVDPADFERQMRWLKRHGYRTVTQREVFDALFRRRSLGQRPILITFDDGYRDVFFRASPVLHRLGFTATAYVVSGRISSGDPSFLTWGMLRGLEKRGIEIGSHTVRHRDLTGISTRDAFSELLASRLALERRLGHAVQWLAYPFGRYDGRVEQLARRAGYVLATTTQPGVRQSARAPLALRRLRVLDSTGVTGLAAMLGG
jgi:peptidoglycan/xylan/chitin deacetylase (PgdA/CDA1 family)